MQGYLISLVLAAAEGPMSPEAAQSRLVWDYTCPIFHIITEGRQAILAGERHRGQFDEQLSYISEHGTLLGVYIASDAILQMMLRIEQAERWASGGGESTEQPMLLEQLIQIAIAGATPVPLWDPPQYPFWELYLDGDCRQCIRVVKTPADALDLARGMRIRKVLCRFVDNLDLAEAAMLLVEHGYSVGDEVQRHTDERMAAFRQRLGESFGTRLEPEEGLEPF